MIVKQRQENITPFNAVLASGVLLGENRNFLKLYTVKVFNITNTKVLSLPINT